MKLLKYIFPLLLIPFFFSDLSAQKEKKTSAKDSLRLTLPKEKQFHMNMTPLLVKFVPFNRETSFTGPYNFMYKSFRGDKAFRLALGAKLNSDAFNSNEDDSHINLRIGYEKRYELSPKWRINRGVDWVATVGGFNVPRPVVTPSFPGFQIVTAGVGAGFSLGVEYRIHPRVSISTESMLFMGLQANTVFGFTVVPPLGLFISANL